MTFDKVEIQWLKTHTSRASQIYESGLEFCFVSDDMRQCHPLVYCKDFLHDVVWGFVNKKRVSIFGFVYNNTPPLCTSSTRLAIANRSDKDFQKNIINTVDFVNQVATKMHSKGKDGGQSLRHTKVLQIVNPPPGYTDVFLLDGSPRWMNAPPLLSLYSLLLRCGLSHTKGQTCLKTIRGIIDQKIQSVGSNDRYQLTKAKPAIDKILKKGYRKFFFKEDIKNYQHVSKVSQLHDAGGIASFAISEMKTLKEKA